jgi:hypothetical protein
MTSHEERPGLAHNDTNIHLSAHGATPSAGQRHAHVYWSISSDDVTCNLYSPDTCESATVIGAVPR